MYLSRNERAGWAIAIVALFALLMIAAGCTQGDGAGAASDAALVAAGKTVYDGNGCKGCHEGGRGPNLSHVGGEPGHTAESLIAHVKNPKATNPGSQMPAYEGKIGDKDFTALGAYLASLK
jgi:mono/diheme cytochrome c family protein